MSIRTIIADDEPLAVRLLADYVERHAALTPAGAYTDPAAALHAIEQGMADLALLDIQMPGMDGLEIARRAAACGTRVIFITAFADYALEGFRLNALHYLLKPVSYDEFCDAVERAVAAAAPPASPPAEQYLEVRADYRRHRIPLNAITHIEALGDYVKIHRTDMPRPTLTQMSLKELLGLFPATFARIHRSFIVNTARITAVDAHTVSVPGATLPCGAAYRTNIP